MNNIHILKRIAKHNKIVWRLFSTLNRECYNYFNIKTIKYEMKFRTIERQGWRTNYKLDGKMHRTDGPAVIFSNGDEDWYINDKLHRSDGPAMIRVNYRSYWFNNDNLHRLDGPAIEYVREEDKQHNQWWIDGKRIEK